MYPFLLKRRHIEGEATVVVGGPGTEEEPWKPVPREVISMDIIENAKKAYHSHGGAGVNSFQKAAHPG